MRLIALSSLLVLSSCASMLNAPTPMASTKYARSEGGSKCLVVLLPGVGDKAENFEKYGFIEAVRARGLSVDLIAAEATYGYYAKGVLVERLGADVVLPAQGTGYAQTWVMGASMGGMGTLLYSRDHAKEISGIFMLAPFLGDPAIAEEVKKAGGLSKWQAPPAAATVTEDNYQREVWRWLQAVTDGREPGPRVYLGWGTEDRLAPQATVLSEALPPERIFPVPGPHKWAIWKTSFDKFLDSSDFARDCR
ncbi:MAG: alpha/beta hydrolase [Archangium gephyra]|uniref:Alpha/beta hydrolase n=1 Tax=Archangium gephyra TaxID=48 RepID=A0A2W5TZ52_9BACT|nr:MAG: alpha/beta hydrolase [Archangium gephyra]